MTSSAFGVATGFHVTAVAIVNGSLIATLTAVGPISMGTTEASVASFVQTKTAEIGAALITSPALMVRTCSLVLFTSYVLLLYVILMHVVLCVS